MKSEKNKFGEFETAWKYLLENREKALRMVLDYADKYFTNSHAQYEKAKLRY